MGLPPEAGPPGVWLRTTWVRRRYYVEDGYIKPIPGSKADAYDPFDAYYGVERAEQGRSLYLDLVALNEEDPRAVEEFTSKWGLLGLFQHELIQVRYVPTKDGRVQPLHNPPPFGTKERIEGHGFGITTQRYLMGFDARDKKLKAEWFERWRNDPDSRGEVIIGGPQTGYVQRPLQDYYAQFFPDLAAKANPAPDLWDHLWERFPDSEMRKPSGLPEYPSLHSPDLWDHLCEPLARFQTAARVFRLVYGSCSGAPDGQGLRVESVELALRQHLQHVHPVPTFRGGSQGGWAWEWSFPSLLAAAYMMLFLDLTGGRNLRFCADEACRKPFVAGRSDKLYCSPKCLNRAKQREWRRKDPEGYNRKRRERRRKAAAQAQGTDGPRASVEA